MNEDLKILLIVVLILLIATAIGVGCKAVQSKYESQAFNRIHGTDYTTVEWFWAEETIKDYHLGTIENKNYNVDLNINKDKEDD